MSTVSKIAKQLHERTRQDEGPGKKRRIKGKVGGSGGRKKRRGDDGEGGEAPIKVKKVGPSPGFQGRGDMAWQTVTEELEDILLPVVTKWAKKSGIKTDNVESMVREMFDNAEFGKLIEWDNTFKKADFIEVEFDALPDEITELWKRKPASDKVEITYNRDNGSYEVAAYGRRSGDRLYVRGRTHRANEKALFKIIDKFYKGERSGGGR